MDDGHTKGGNGGQSGTERSLQTYIPEAKVKAREVSRVTAPTLELPKGGGAIRGIGETFSANVALGTSGVSVPILVSPGRGGAAPQLALSYSSGGGNSTVGFNWSVGHDSVKRRTDKKLPTYDDATDLFLVGGDEELVPVLHDVTVGGVPTKQPLVVLWPEASPTERRERFQPRVEGAFARIERVTRLGVANAVPFWRVTTRDNVVTEYGRSAEARIADPADPTRVLEWLAERTWNDNGDVTAFVYVPDDAVGSLASMPSERNRHHRAQRYLKRIWYGPRTMYVPTDVPPALTAEDFCFEVVFDYGEHHPTAPTPQAAPGRAWPMRADAFSSYRGGFELRTQRICYRVLMFHRVESATAPVLVASTDMGYDFDPAALMLKSVTHRRYVPTGAGGYTSKAQPPVTFTYSPHALSPMPWYFDRRSLADVPAGIAGGRFQWVDLHQEGIAGLLTEQGGQWYYKRNEGEGRFGPLEALPTRPSVAGLRAPGHHLADLGGDGGLQMVVDTPQLQGFFERTEDGGWEPFQTFVNRLGIDVNAPNVRILDLDGDGRPDVLLTDYHAYTVWLSKGRLGYEAPHQWPVARDDERGPRAIYSDPRRRIFTADMTGDGLQDIVCVENGNVCYWPNLGYGRFGAKVTMNDSPVFDDATKFHTDRIRLADLDGTGTTDILYFSAHSRPGAKIWRNRAGNGFGPAESLPYLPTLDPLRDYAVTDVLGRGTASLVWSSAYPTEADTPMRALDLFSEGKPRLLVSMENHHGSRTEIEYESSVQQYLRDRREGHPWKTRLPFPVHVVSRVTTRDLVSGSHHTVSYRYRHGYYDREEREFRGFACVEQTDAGSFLPFVGGGTFGATPPELMAQPPVVTKTWMHTGAYVGNERLEVALRAEYWRGDVVARDHQQLPITTLPEAHTPNEKRLMARSLRGRTLRTEVYANDGTAQAGTPYAVTETRYAPRVVQAAAAGYAPVVAVDPCESVSWHYEREEADPRVTHQLTLAVDAYGTVTSAATVGYGRRGEAMLTALTANDPEGAQAIREAQAKVTVLVQTTQVANVADDPTMLRLGVPVATATWEVTGITPPPVPAATVTPLARPTRLALLDAAAIRPALTLGSENTYAYHQTPPTTPAAMRRRLLERSEVRYRNDALDATLPLGSVGRRALTDETRQAAFTPQMLADTFRDASGASLLGDVNAADNSVLAGEAGYVLADGLWWARSGRAVYDASNFYQVQEALDPWGNGTDIEYGPMGLFVVRTIDALGNRTEVAYDTRLMAPYRLTDANDNRVMVTFDTLGRVVETYTMGKETGTAEGDVPPSVSTSGGTPVITPGLPGTVITYDEEAWHREQKPVWARVAMRENAGDANSRWQETIVYSDGFGRELVTKVRCEPNPATPTVPRWRATGRTVYNLKGLPVKKYEPYFSDTDAYDPEGEGVLSTGGVTPILHYDPMGRVVRTDLPDGTYSRVEFDPWHEAHFDANDTVADSAWRAARLVGAGATPPTAAEARALELTMAHASTPTTIYADALGRPVATVAHNGLDASNNPVLYATRVELDVQGQQRKVVDALGRLVQWSNFDMLGRATITRAMDAAGPALPTSATDADVLAARSPGGTTTALRVSTKLADVAGKHIKGWTERGYCFHDYYDALRRLTQVHITHPGDDDEPTTDYVSERLVYGEALGATDARDRNLRGRLWRLYDGAGRVESLQHDYRGRLIQAARRLPKDHATAPDWRGAAPNDALLLAETFTTTTVFDALGRVLEQEAPQSSGNDVGNAATTHARKTRYLYHDGGALRSVEARYEGDADGTWRPYVTDIRYNARGQRTRVDYGSDAKTYYDYDPKTFRLRDLRHTVVQTEGGSSTTKTAMHCTYTYDPVGNLVQVRDESVPTGARMLSTLEPNDSLYEYDALYRLVSAIGREHPANTPPDSPPEGPGTGGPDHTHPNDLTALSRYQENYSYDRVGNFTQMQHLVIQGGGVGWTRVYEYTAATNRLRRTRAPAEPSSTAVDDYGYDAHGNMTRMPHLPDMKWDAYEQLVNTRKGAGSTHIRVRCQYDAQGQRVRKVVEHWSGSGESAGVAWIEERLYLGGYEVHRKHAGNNVESAINREVQTLHVVDGEQRIAMITTKTVDTSVGGVTTVYLPGDRDVRTRFQLGNHLGSAAVEADGAGEVVTYEEYHPYGTCAMLYKRAGTADEPKRYRFTGMERDETGLQYHTARYWPRA